MIRFGIAAALSCFAGSAFADTINLSTTPGGAWQVFEESNGQLVGAAPTYIGNTQYGNVPGFTVPFSDCDGFWLAALSFNLPEGATDVILSITGIGVDDRAVMELNGNVVASVGANMKGVGSMQFFDPGKNRRWKFRFNVGPVKDKVRKGFVTGTNNLTIIVNNTGNGISGTIQPLTQNNPSNVGLSATVSYSAPSLPKP